MAPMRRALALVAAAVLLCACKVDTTVSVTVERDGSGSIAVTATADKAVVDQAPGLAEDLRFDDATAAGWVLDGPTATEDGGLTVTLTHDFSTVEEATALLASINGVDGPLHDVAITRTVDGDDVTTVLAGTLRVDGGVNAFADPDLLAAIGGSPYADDIAATGLRPGDVVTVTFTADLPGSVVTTDTIATGENGLTWTVPIDGTAADLSATAQSSGSAGGPWGLLANVALGALIVWVLLAAAFIAFVVVARRRRAARRATARH